MLRVLVSSLIVAVGLPAFLNWGSRQAENQIDRMQEAAFNTPGAEAPIPPQVLLGGLAVLLAYILTARLLGLRRGQALLSLLLGSALGTALFLTGGRSNPR